MCETSLKASAHNNLRAIMAVVREAGIHIFIVPHHR
jgi:hypothetical protein